MTDEERAELEALRIVADAAAFATIDLASNLSSAYKEYMAGDLARGAYEYVLMRQTSLLIALQKAGYTEKHKLFEFPVKPESNERSDGGLTAPPTMAAASSLT